MIILQALYFMLPVYFANMAPVFATKIFGQKLSWPIDFNIKLNNKPLLGKNKTWRGLVAGIIIGIAIIYLQAYLYQLPVFKSLSILNYSLINLIVYGFLFSFGAILADAVKSFIKRRLDIKPGNKWFPWDQADFLGGLILIMLVYIPPWQIIIAVLIISPFLPLMANWLGYLLKIKKVPW